MKVENQTLISKSTYQTSPINETSKIKKGCEPNISDETINIDPYLLSIKLKKAIPSIDKDISDLNQTICHLIYSNKNMANEAKRRGSKSRKVTTKPPIDYSSSDKEKIDEEKSKDSAYESNLKSPSKNKVFEMSRLSREAKFQLEKSRSRKNDRSSNRMSKERSKSRKYRAQSSGIIEPNLNFHFHQDKIAESYQRGISVHSRTRAPSNLRAPSKAKITSSRHNIHIEKNIPDFPIPLPDESSEYLILPTKHFFPVPPVEKINYAPNKFRHHHNHQQHQAKYQPLNQNFYQHTEPNHFYTNHPKEPPQQHYYPTAQNEKPQQQFYPQTQNEQSQHHFYPTAQNEQQQHLYHNQPNDQNQHFSQQQIQPQIPQLNQQQIVQNGQQIQVDLTPQQAQLFLNSNPAQQAEIINKIQQQVLSSQFPPGTQAEVQVQPQLGQQQQQQPNAGLSSVQQLEMTLQKLQNLYINPAMQQYQQQNQQSDLGMQYLALQNQNQPMDMVNNSQQSTQQQIQNLLSLQQQQQQQNAGMYNQNHGQQYYNAVPQDIQAAGSKHQQTQQSQSQNQQQYFLNQNQINVPAGLKSSKMGMNFLGMMFDQPNQSQY
ncbi:hypothetical protein BpHYR1_003739 [Brachionus plicatilis]|uniref:Uncharacterized protein n=1 Tax=Brachionus plicatilis TaxID=10195 RepID=A0A3M7QU86_BRAPC|nr:hypothetical protein BpHYR1_003739 [Brachionus plicatilis]